MARLNDSIKTICEIQVYSETLTYEQLIPYTEILPPEAKSKALEYMKREAYETAAAAGYVFDAVTGKYTNIPLLAYEDGEYSWDGREIYYLEKYDLKLKTDFLRKALR